jgi:predicted DNA-binding helix-hairpin-helix protein
MNLKRVYYSAFVPATDNSNLPTLNQPPLLREHRLYQADWLLRFYNFSANELLTEDNPDLNLDFDPKVDWALRNLEKFPVEINHASYDMLLRIPGVGPKSARKIVSNRQKHGLSYRDIKEIGPVLKRAKYFITCKGKYYGGLTYSNKEAMREQVKTRLSKGEDWEQPTLF